MKLTPQELKHLTLCLGRCITCSESSTCLLKSKVQQIDDRELDDILYDALANHYHRLYQLK